MARIGEVQCREQRYLDFLGLRIRIDLGNEAAVQEDASDAFLDPAAADPTDRGPGERKGRLSTGLIRGGGAPVAQCRVHIRAPTRAAVDNGRIRIFEARHRSGWRRRW